MALTRAKKNEKVKQLAASWRARPRPSLARFKGLTASKDFELRKVDPRGRRLSYHVVKNKLAAKSAKGTKVEAALQGLKGVSARGLHLGRPGRAGQGPLHLGQGQRRVHLQARHRRRQGHQRQRRSTQLAKLPGQGRALLEAPLPHPVARRSASRRSSTPPAATSPWSSTRPREGQVRRSGCRSSPGCEASKPLRQKQ